MKHSIIFSLRFLLVVAALLLGGCALDEALINQDGCDGSSCPAVSDETLDEEAKSQTAADTCAKIRSRGVHEVNYDSDTAQRFPAFCTEDGWTLLGVGRGGSENWGPVGDYWEVDYQNGVQNEAGDPTSKKDQRTFGYERLRTNKIKLCYEDEDRCFVFDHGQDRTLFSFFDDDVSHVEGEAEAPSDFLKQTGFKTLGGEEEDTQIKCFRLGINLPVNTHDIYNRSKGRIGLIGYISTCDRVAEYTENDLAFGLGMLSYEGVSSNSAGYSRYVDSADGVQLAPNPQLVGSWSIFGK